MTGPVRGLYVGRFQPFHRGHLELVRGILDRAPEAELLVAIGSAEQAFTWENPFTAGERFEMIDRAVREAKLARVAIVPVPDIARHALWVRYLEGLLPPFEQVYTHNPLTRLLFVRAGYPVEVPPLFDRVRHEGSRLRELLARGEDIARFLPPAVDRYLRELGAAERLRALRPDARARRPPPRR
ncbi:MAG TPA: nicotinamide-nucleotide adenylyltransferase [Thermoplasmata archaeon]|nr:nicotinamide-nucleotide adenylyltransferase [Thermoplasmata archaeon]